MKALHHSSEICRARYDVWSFYIVFIT